jgi:Icc-related predicted phosphoesterase
MIIDCVGCLHGARPELQGGDLLIITGDLTATGTIYEHADFLGWLNIQKYKKKIFIAGNHDNNMDEKFYWDDSLEYLCDSGTEFMDLKLWGSPWTSRFEGINPECCAFTGATDDEISKHFNKIPEDVDILVTHSPPFTIRDRTKDGKQVGSPSLMALHLTRFKPKLWVFSHVHEGYGVDGPYPWSGTRYVNCSIMNERYQPVNAPIRIELSN